MSFHSDYKTKTKCLNPTGAKKKTVKISRKETEAMLSKLDESFSSIAYLCVLFIFSQCDLSSRCQVVAVYMSSSCILYTYQELHAVCSSELANDFNINNLILMSIFQELEKKDDGNPEKSDDETEKKPGDKEEEEEIEAEEYDEEDIEEVRLQIITLFPNVLMGHFIPIILKRRQKSLQPISQKLGNSHQNYQD